MKKIMPLRHDRKTWLCGTIAEPKKGLASHRGSSSPYCFFFHGTGSAAYTVEVTHADTYSMKIGYYAASSTRLTLECEDQRIIQTLDPVQGYASQMIPMYDHIMMQNPEDTESVDIIGTFTLGEGIHDIVITAETSREFRIYYLEMIPDSAREAIQAEEARALDARTPIEPVASSGYGLFIHWTERTKPRYGKELSYHDAVDQFDVEAFADQCRRMGAKYVIFTAEHVSMFFPAPIASWLKYHPGDYTTKRDLIAELIDALGKRDIQLWMYLHIPMMANYPPVYKDEFNFTNEELRSVADQDEMCNRVCEMLTEIGARYGEGIKGYWLDGWHLAILKYGIDPTERVYAATKVGNPNRCTSFAFGVRCPTFTPWQDYACGETRVIGALPVDGKYARGQNKGYLYHSIIVLDDDWWHDYYDSPIAPPQYTADQLAPYLRGCMDNGGLVSINTAVYQDGSVGMETLRVMEQTKRWVYR
ncbi:hypothetical protein FACS1894184_04410 [Clostridia bacterium]|nr:hypothetical protein FACS1894184_04410 [Clostridia bacterium]